SYQLTTSLRTSCATCWSPSPALCVADWQPWQGGLMTHALKQCARKRSYNQLHPLNPCWTLAPSTERSRSLARLQQRLLLRTRITTIAASLASRISNPASNRTRTAAKARAGAPTTAALKNTATTTTAT
ncbi:hypothetical protein BGZ99_003929, partial [Dissophora globulifera]